MSQRLLYLDASAGVSGDMFVGALLDAGADIVAVREDVLRVGLVGVDVRVRKVKRGGLVGTKFDVIDRATGLNVDGAPPEPAAAGATGGTRQNHTQAHRGLGEIKRLIRDAGLPTAVTEHAVAVFELLGQAEAKVHGIAPDQVHFHEVGALDAIVDVVSAASAFHLLGAGQAWCSPVQVGCGSVRCAHGVLPVPAPATAELLRGIPVYSNGVQGELCTPTGAALVRHFCQRFGAMPPMVVEMIGYGAGSKDLAVPNLLRALVGRAADGSAPDEPLQSS